MTYKSQGLSIINIIFLFVGLSKPIYRLPIKPKPIEWSLIKQV